MKRHIKPLAFSDRPSQIKALRKRTGLTQAKLGTLLGLGQNNYSPLETGKHTPTSGQIAAANMAAFLAESGLLEEYAAYLDALYPQQ